MGREGRQVQRFSGVKGVSLVARWRLSRRPDTIRTLDGTDLALF